MSENKTQPTGMTVGEFIDSKVKANRQEDAWALVDMHTEITGHEPVMWGPSIIGFDTYHYVYDSGRQGHMPAAAFSPRAASQTLYIAQDFPGREELLEQLGKHKLSKGCVYITKLADVDMSVLRALIAASYKHTKEELDQPPL